MSFEPTSNQLQTSTKYEVRIARRTWRMHVDAQGLLSPLLRTSSFVNSSVSGFFRNKLLVIARRQKPIQLRGIRELHLQHPGPMSIFIDFLR